MSKCNLADSHAVKQSESEPDSHEKVGQVQAENEVE